ncbi:hypothetical protein EIN_430870 [Entamoeba invadens IP1]|uniref:Uncharacterized protein n=1 Tax=Entamoeba invadens IP1 TaxID=370355 RepID=A0A0A1UF94_ENTIV|nr:hypothetical protein EIN_430870 [Entamoeba invadens IP1]ELP95281.1 hypothetical protein EIN_430870 [Entamoeba invadens IP1]|eukprot:XP_004262052.1 hypothetical protein EIN_430870 [Entamoeba invadens IP1]
MSLFLVLCTFFTLCLSEIDPWIDNTKLSSHLRVKRAINFAREQEQNLRDMVTEDITRPFVRGNSFTTSLSMFPNLEMLVVTSTLAYKTKYENNTNAPKLILTLKDSDGITTTKELTYTTLSQETGQRLKEIDWKTSFFPLTNFTKTLSFLVEPKSDTTNAFVAFLSYPVSSTAMSKPTFGKTLTAFHITGGENKDSNTYSIVGNVFIDFELKLCTSFFDNGFNQNYEETMEEWSEVLSTTMWTEGIDVSMLITFSLQGYFCFPLIDYVFFSETSKVSTEWKYCDKYIEDSDKFKSDPCCNREAEGKCNTFRDRKSTYMGIEPVCMFDFLKNKDVNLTNKRKIELNERSYAMGDFTQYLHDFHFWSLPTILWNHVNQNQVKRFVCRNIFNDPTEYINNSGGCPIDMHKVSGFEADSTGCYTPTDNQIDLFIDLCVSKINIDNGELDRFEVSELQEGVVPMFQAPTKKEYPYDSAHPNNCYSYDGRIFNSKEDNTNCEGYVCDINNDRWVFKTKEEAIAKCPQLTTSCAIQSQGCGIGDNVNLPNNSIEIGDSFKRFVKVIDLTSEECANIKGIDLNLINSSIDDEYECLSQVVGCADYLSPEFKHCDEASMLTNVFEFHERVLPKAEMYRLKRATASTNATFEERNLVSNYEDINKVFYMQYFLGELKQRAPVLFKYFNREISAFITDCIFIEDEKFSDYTGAQFPLTVQTLNRDKSEQYEKVQIEPADEKEDLKMTEYDRCYACGSTVIFGSIDGNVQVNGYQFPLLNYWSEATDVAKENLGFLMPVKYNDSIGGRDENFTIGYIVGDAVKFNKIVAENHTTIYIGISEFSTVDFTEASTYPINDFLRIRNTTENGQIKLWIEPLYLECVHTSSDENKLVFDFSNPYILCKVPESVYETLTPDDGILPIYRLPKNKIRKEYPEDSNTQQIIIIVVPVVVGVIAFVALILGTIVFIVRHRRRKGREMLKEYNELELSSLGGPLIQYD